MLFKLSLKARKQLKKVPVHIRNKFDYWLDLINYIGLIEARKYKGFHDEPLKGKKKGLRSVRLSKGYRVIYLEEQNALKEQITIIEVNKHEYR